MDSGTYRDGFSTDLDTSPNLISLLGFVNMAQRLMCGKASFALDDFAVSITSSGEADLPEECGEILYALWSTTELIPTTYEEATRRVIRTGSSATGSPTVYYTVGRRVGVRRKPSTTGTITLKGRTIPEDLTAPSDVPTLVPPRYHEALAVMATMILCVSDSDDSTAVQQAQGLAGLFEVEAGELAKEIDVRSMLLRGA